MENFKLRIAGITFKNENDKKYFYLYLSRETSFQFNKAGDPDKINNQVNSNIVIKRQNGDMQEI